MGRVNRESLGLADCPGPQAGVCFFPSSSESAYSSSRQPLSRGERDDEGGDRESPPQRSSGEGGPNPGHILPHLFGPQTRQRLAPSYKPQAFEQFSESRAFQDGESDVSARPPPERRPHGQSRFERCVPDGTHPPSGQEVPPLQLGTGDLPVSLPPLWSGVCASNLHQAPQTIVSPAEVTGPQNGGVLGRYSTHGFIGGADRSASDTSRVLAGRIGVHNQQRQERDGARSPDRVSWFDSQLQHNVTLSPSRQDCEGSEGMSPHVEQRSGISPGAVSLNRTALFSNLGSPPSSFTLPGPSETQTPGSHLFGLLGLTGVIGLLFSEGFSVLSLPVEGTQWEEPQVPCCNYDYLFRCLQIRLVQHFLSGRALESTMP